MAKEFDLAERINDLDETVQDAIAEIEMISTLAIHRMKFVPKAEADKLTLAFDLIKIRCAGLGRQVGRVACSM